MPDITPPDMVTIRHRAVVAGDADAAWAKVGGFFDLDRFLDVTCDAAAGDGGLGSVRIVNGAIVEPMVGASARSYTYAQTRGPMSAHAYHGCVSCEPHGLGKCEIAYAIVYDQSGIDPGRRQAERDRLTARFAAAHAAMVAAAAGA